MGNYRSSRFMLFFMGLLLAGWAVKIEAGQANSPSRQAEADRVTVGPSDIGV